MQAFQLACGTVDLSRGPRNLTVLPRACLERPGLAGLLFKAALNHHSSDNQWFD